MNEKYDFIDNYLKCVSSGNYFNIEYRASRTEFNLFWITVYGVLFGFIYLQNKFNFPEWTNWIFGIWLVFNFVPLFTVAARRMIDIGITRYWLLAITIPFFNFILILFLCFKPTKVIKISDKNRAIAFLKQGNYFFKSGKFNEAIENYDKALEINSDFQEAHRNREKAFKKL